MLDDGTSCRDACVLGCRSRSFGQKARAKGGQATHRLVCRRAFRTLRSAVSTLKREIGTAVRRGYPGSTTGRRQHMREGCTSFHGTESLIRHHVDRTFGFLLRQHSCWTFIRVYHGSSLTLTPTLLLLCFISRCRLGPSRKTRATQSCPCPAIHH